MSRVGAEHVAHGSDEEDSTASGVGRDDAVRDDTVSDGDERRDGAVPDGDALRDGDAVRQERGGVRSALGVLVAGVRELVVILAMALVLSFVVKTWLIQAFFIPSGSMEDTLLIGDRVIVSKLTPGPFELARGDVVVFEDPGGWLPETPAVERTGVGGAVHDGLVFVGLLPAESEDHLIKRVIGLPGDHVVCCSATGSLSVNGVDIAEPYIKDGDVPSSVPFDITVPEGHVWVMGDHRSDSEDSRFHDDPSDDGSEGSVPVADITGRAVSIVWPLNRFHWLSDHPETFSGVPAPTPSP